MDEENYRWEAVLYFYLTWDDPYAFDTAKGACTASLKHTFVSAPALQPFHALEPCRAALAVQLAGT